MPVYNCEAYIDRSIRSVLNQTYRDWELLIADDGSTDRTYEIIISFDDPRIRRYRNSRNLGNITTRNALFQQASGEFLTVLDGDDFMSEKRLEEQINEFRKDKELNVCFTNYYEVYPGRQPTVKYQLKHDYYLKIGDFESSFLTMPATIMIRYEVYQKIGGLHPYFDRLFAEDKYWVYCIIEQFKTLVLKSPLYFYFANPSSLTNLIDNPRKLTVVALVNELIRQRKLNGSDWLSKGMMAEALKYESKLIKNRKWLSENYRIFAARQIDLSKKKEASIFLLRAFKINPFNFSVIRTIFYFLRRFYG